MSLHNLEKISEPSKQDVILEEDQNKFLVRGKIFLVIVFFLALTFLLYFLAKENRALQVSNDELRYSIVEKGIFSKKVVAQGEVRSRVERGVYSLVNGVIEINVEIGDAVKKDELIATIKSPELLNKLMIEESELEKLYLELDGIKILKNKQVSSAKQAAEVSYANMELSEKILERFHKAFNVNVISQIEFDKVRTELKKAKIEYKYSISEIDSISENFQQRKKIKQQEIERQKYLINELKRKEEKLFIKSPVSGLVSGLHVAQQSNLVPNQKVLSIIDLDSVDVVLEIPQLNISQVHTGQTVVLEDKNVSYTAKVKNISPEVVNQYISVSLTLDDLNQKKHLRQGQKLLGTITLNQTPNALFIEKGSYFNDVSRNNIFVVENDYGIKRNIVTGQFDLNKVEILDGLEEGEKVIISSFEKAEMVSEFKISY